MLIAMAKDNFGILQNFCVGCRTLAKPLVKLQWIERIEYFSYIKQRPTKALHDFWTLHISRNLFWIAKKNDWTQLNVDTVRTEIDSKVCMEIWDRMYLTAAVNGGIKLLNENIV